MPTNIDLQKARTSLRKTHDTPLASESIAPVQPEQSEPIASVPKDEGLPIDGMNDDAMDVSKAMASSSAEKISEVGRGETTRVQTTAIHPVPTTIEPIANVATTVSGMESLSIPAHERETNDITHSQTIAPVPTTSIPSLTSSPHRESIQTPLSSPSPTKISDGQEFEIQMSMGDYGPETQKMLARSPTHSDTKIANAPSHTGLSLLDPGGVGGQELSPNEDFSLPMPTTRLGGQSAQPINASISPPARNNSPIASVASSGLGQAIANLTSSSTSPGTAAASVLSSGGQQGSQTGNWQQELLDAIRKLTEAIEELTNKKADKEPGPQKDGSFIPSLARQATGQAVSAIGSAAGNIAGGSSADMVKTITETLARAALAAAL